MFLDVIQDRYVCLSAKAERALRAIMSGGELGNDPASRALIEGGLVVRAEGCSTIIPTSNPPSAKCSILDEHSKQPRWHWVMRAGATLASTRILLRTAGLDPTLQRLRATRERSAGKNRIDESVREIAGAYERLNVLLSPLDQCLPRSIALAHLLMRSGHAAQLVIGIRLKPFLAHSWVQQRDVLLNERVDVARTFTPILVI